MEVQLIVLAAGLVLFIPVGSILGFIAFRQRHQYSSRIESLGREVSELRREVEAFRRSGVVDAQAPLEPQDEPVDSAYVQST
ncbi:MAG: hypothetical protein ACTHZR_09625, partial [Marinobacter sp.]